MTTRLGGLLWFFRTLWHLLISFVIRGTDGLAAHYIKSSVIDVAKLWLQGPRQLRVEVEDTDGNTSIRTMTNTGMVIFSTEAPVITGGNEYIANQPRGQVSSIDTKGPNKTSFTATVTLKGAEMPLGEIGEDSTLIGTLQYRGLFGEDFLETVGNNGVYSRFKSKYQ